MLNRISFGLVILVQQLLQGRLGFRVTQDAAGVSEDLNLGKARSGYAPDVVICEVGNGAGNLRD